MRRDRAPSRPAAPYLLLYPMHVGMVAKVRGVGIPTLSPVAAADHGFVAMKFEQVMVMESSYLCFPMQVIQVRAHIQHAHTTSNPKPKQTEQRTKCTPAMQQINQ